MQKDIWNNSRITNLNMEGKQFCNKEGVCLLKYGEYRRTIDENFIVAEGIKVARPRGGGFRVYGGKGRVGVISLSRFPSLLFEE